jgi:MinD-like ATPase involved in chromosome partitioning or flagellar assembly
VSIPIGDGEIILMGRHLYLAPAQLTVEQINESLKQGCDPLSLTQGLSKIIRKLKLNYLLIDSHPDLDEETMLMITISDVLLLVVSLENYILQETAVTIDVARSLSTPYIRLLANQVLPSFDLEEVRQKLQETYGEPVLDVVPFVEELMALASREIFCQRFPNHTLTQQFRAIAQELIALSSSTNDVTSPSITNTELRVEAVNRYQQSPMLDLMTCPELYRRIVYYLMAHGASTSAEIAAHLKTDGATIQPILGTLTEQGLVSKEVHQDDIRYQARL